MSNLFALFKIIWMSPEWNVPRSLVTWWLKRKFAVDNGRRSIRMEEQINQSFAIGMNGNLKLNSFLVPLLRHILICIFSHLNVWLVGVVLGHLFCLVWHSGTSVTWAAVTCCLWGLATKHYNQSSNFLCLVAVQISAAKVGILDQPGALSQSQFFSPQIGQNCLILRFWLSDSHSILLAQHFLRWTWLADHQNYGKERVAWSCSEHQSAQAGVCTCISKFQNYKTKNHSKLQ